MPQTWPPLGHSHPFRSSRRFHLIVDMQANVFDRSRLEQGFKSIEREENTAMLFVYLNHFLTCRSAYTGAGR